MSDPVLINPDPRTRINDRWLLRNQQLQTIVESLDDSISYKNFIDYFCHDMENQHAELGQQSFLHVITETVYHYPTTYLSEKPIKPITCKRPFVVLGPLGSLAALRQLGFKTFGDFWDESYDTIVDPEKRLVAVVDVIEWVCDHTIAELQRLCTAMTDVLNYNFVFYVNHFQKIEADKLEKKCMVNLKPRYDTDQNPDS